MLGASNVLNVSGSNQPLSKSLDVEREYLSQLGSSLGRCAEKMVCLALQEARRLLSGASSISQGDTRDQWAYFIVAMAPALDHTEIDTKVSTSWQLSKSVFFPSISSPWVDSDDSLYATFNGSPYRSPPYYRELDVCLMVKVQILARQWHKLFVKSWTKWRLAWISWTNAYVGDGD